MQTLLNTLYLTCPVICISTTIRCQARFENRNGQTGGDRCIIWEVSACFVRRNWYPSRDCPGLIGQRVKHWCIWIANGCFRHGRRGRQWQYPVPGATRALMPVSFAWPANSQHCGKLRNSRYKNCCAALATAMMVTTPLFCAMQPIR